MNFLKEKRKALNLTQKDVATQLKISSQAYGHYEKGLRSIPIEFIIPLASILNIDIETLVREVTSELLV